MQTIQAYFDGSVFIPVEQITVEMNQKAIITILDNEKDSEFPRQKAGKSFLRFAGAISDENYLELEDILRDTRHVDINEW
jgi:hypothetical protein